MIARLPFNPQIRTLEMAKILCVLYADPMTESYPCDDLPKIDHYPSQRPDVPDAELDRLKPGALLGSKSLRRYLGSPGHTSSSLPTRGPNSPCGRSFRTPSSRSLSGPPI
jgi:hypothetical protein